jgi:2-oxoisovalerate dehydrogenase E1 component beta subunit
MAEMTMVQALNEGLRRSLEDDDRVLVMGEDVGSLGGVFRVTDGLLKDFGRDRIIDTPLAESGIVGSAIGLAMRGFRPVVEIQFDGFLMPALDQIINQAAKMGLRTAGRVRVPLTIRVPYGGGIGAVEHHSESPEAYLAHTPGIRVVSCASPGDAYWMIRQAVRCDDPVVLLEPKRRYWDRADVAVAGTPPDLHAARVVLEGTDCTLIAYGPTVRLCVEAAAAAPELSLEVVDLRSLSPLDFTAVASSARKTRRVVVVHEAPVFMGFGAEIAARVTERCFYSLEAPVLRVGGPHVPYPPGRLEAAYLPDLDRVLDAVERSMSF